MKILFLTPQAPYPPRQGAALRNYHLLRHCASKHEVHLLTCLPHQTKEWSEPELSNICSRVEGFHQSERPLHVRLISSFASTSPDMALRLEQEWPHATLQQMLVEESYDLVQVEGLEMAPYGFRVLSAFADRPPVVFDAHNAEYLLQKRAALMDARSLDRWHAAGYSILQWRKLYHYEKAFCQAVDGIICVSEPDRRALSSLAPQTPIVSVPNGIEISRYEPGPLAATSPPLLVFTGKMDYRPNVDAMLWFGLKVFPRIRRQMDVRLQIVGMDPHPRLDRLRTIAGVDLTGAVDDVVPYIRGASVYLTPMRVGGGTRFKVLEAMACAKPVVSTSLGVEGIPLRDGKHLYIADDEQSFADAVLSLLRDQDAGGRRSRALGMAGRSFVEERFTWDTILPLMD